MKNNRIEYDIEICIPIPTWALHKHVVLRHVLKRVRHRDAELLVPTLMDVADGQSLSTTVKFRTTQHSHFDFVQLDLWYL